MRILFPFQSPSLFYASQQLQLSFTSRSRAIRNLKKEQSLESPYHQGSERNGFERCRFAFCSATLSRKRFCFPFRFSKNRCRFVPVSKAFEKNRFRFVSVPKRLKENRSRFAFRFVPERVSFRNTILIFMSRTFYKFFFTNNKN